MRGWFLAVAMTVLACAEVALGPLLTDGEGAGPDLLLVLAVFLALRAPRSVHPAVYFALGTVSDLLAVPQPGLRGFSYVAAALAVEWVSPGRMRRNPLVLGVLGAAAGLGVEMVYLCAGQLWRVGASDGALGVVLHSALFTGAAGLVLSWPTDLLARLFGWPPTGAPLSWGQLMAAAASGTARAPDRRKG